MKKKLIILVLGGVLAGAAAVVFLEPSGVVLGWVRGESFFQDRPTRYWRKALQDKDPGGRTNTLHMLSRHGAEPVPVLLELLRDPKADVRWTAATALGSIGADAKDAVPALAEALSDDDP